MLLLPDSPPSAVESLRVAAELDAALFRAFAFSWLSCGLLLFAFGLLVARRAERLRAELADDELSSTQARSSRRCARGPRARS